MGLSSSPKKKKYPFLKDLSSLDTSRASAIENILLTPMNELREAISQTSEFLFHSSPIKAKATTRNNKTIRFHPSISSEGNDTDKVIVLPEEKKEEEKEGKKFVGEEKEEMFIIKRPSIRSSQFFSSPQFLSSSPRTVIDVRPCGTGIELVVDNRFRDTCPVDALDTLDTVKNDRSKRIRLKSPNIRGSLLLFDPIANAEDQMKMNIKILQAKNLPFDNTKVRICVLNREGGAVDQIIGCTPNSNGSRNPIWGSQICSWAFKGNLSTKILLTLVTDETYDKGNTTTTTNNSSSRTKLKRKKGKPLICAKVSASDLLLKTNPNFWIKLKDHSESGGETSTSNIPDCGRVQIRLNTPREAILHEQENCYRITAGPAMLQAMPRMQSYAIRKMAMYSVSPVTLNVYDVSNNPKIETINNTMKPFGYGGIFHAAIEIHGKEYSFGGTLNKRSNISGIFPCSPKECPMHHYRESVFLGDCELDAEQVTNILKVLRPKWPARSYNVFSKNCAFFSREFAIELGVGDLPEWVYCLATTGQSTIEPFIKKLDQYLRNRTQNDSNEYPAKSNQLTTTKTKTKTKSKPTSKEKSMKKDPSKKALLKADIATNDHMEAHCVAKNTQEALFDHAMAAKIQRSFRNAKSKRVTTHRAKYVNNT